MVYGEPKRLADFLPLVLWEYRTSKCTSTQATSFSLVDGIEAIAPIEVIIPSTHLALSSKVFNPNNRIYDVEATLEEKIHNSEEKGYLTEDKSIELIMKKEDLA